MPGAKAEVVSLDKSIGTEEVPGPTCIDNLGGDDGVLISKRAGATGLVRNKIHVSGRQPLKLG